MKRHFSSKQNRLVLVEVFDRVTNHELTLKDAAQLVRLSYRQCKRLFQRFTADGTDGLLHRARDKPSNHAIACTTKQAILDRYRQRYPDFGPTLG